MTAKPFSHWLAIAGLTVLALMLFVRLPLGWLQLTALPVVIILAWGLRSTGRWGGWAAVLMVPYVCAGVMDVLVTTDNRWQPILLTVSAVLVFLAGLDSVRRTGTSLRS